MYRFIMTTLFIFILALPGYASVGFRQLTLDAQSSRPLPITLWYPTRASGPPQATGENAAFYGESVIRNAEPEAGIHPLVLLSHGYGGSWRNLNWLAVALVAQGYSVAAPDHPGTSSENRDPAAARALWHRPEDISRLLDALLQQPALAGRIDATRIAAMGHSLGGWTVMALAGARFSAPAFLADCHQHRAFSDCKLAEKLGITSPENAPLLAANFRDGRIRAVVTLDAGVTRGFTKVTLSQMALPVLLLAAEKDAPDLPASLESGFLAAHLPPSRVQVYRVGGANHFSFMQRCKPEGAAIIERASPGDGMICHDGDARGRAVIHQAALARILPFLTAALAPAAGEKHSASAR
ncbi:alpha/beta fold hydrolase [Pantoea sp. Mb-10]|uniref:alpha/beta hydrolase family protein n=1 Tax=unclassified Pantoea TaxID=2630326 RepID=UPI001E5610E9|nr:MULTISPECIES: alpha/beta fold hydrolase [unclassified Pantoea]MCE0490725.1 alpha/beta fold hydrolase [Pantoea sp. Mb-10]MCE0500117.1 alpha/beta fold hydrolase [Pantoea sp. Pb-8]